MSEDIRLNQFTMARKCACKGWIFALEASTRIGEAVEEHQQTTEHKSWDLEAWTEENTAKVPVRTQLRKVA